MSPFFRFGRKSMRRAVVQQGAARGDASGRLATPGAEVRGQPLICGGMDHTAGGRREADR